ncbi:hypothetical protein [Lentzea sp. NPDC059081]|uniref:hypothetical protein n=1 Tax=Lentzea sp. NPDC059081 TaxID=3346719 RepID=UPI0036857420
MRKTATGMTLALSFFAALATFVPAQAQAGTWVYVQYWRATNAQEAALAQFSCHYKAANSYPGHNHECRVDVPDYTQLWVEY